MTAILLVGLSLFICSAVAIYLTLQASSVADLHRKPMRRRGLKSLKNRKNRRLKAPDTAALADRRNLEESARSLEGAIFFF